MARMFPRTLGADVKSLAEVKVFAALERGLDEGWEVFHSAGMMIRDPGTGAEDDEADFVLCHPNEGIIALEVKGGGIECRHGTWYRLARDGSRERIPDPITQAVDHKHSLRRAIEAADGRRHRDLFLIHAIAFPDISVHALALAPDAPRGIIIDRRDLDDVDATVARVLAHHRGARDTRDPPGQDGLAMLRDLLAPSIRIEVPLATTLEEEESALVELTREQAALLRRFGRDRRMVVTGCAGSGKTTIAIERGRELAQDGLDVLFVCFNRALAAELKDATTGMDVSTFHSLCVRWARREGIALPEYEGDPPPEYWNEILPDALADAMAQTGGRYDAILVDEAQDLHNHWLTALTFALRDEEEGSIWLFMDDNQRVYEAQLDVPREYRPFDLTVNCRNTQSIHREVMKLYAGSVKPEAKGPEGRSVDFYPTADQPATVAAVLDRLRREDDVRARDIVVLSAHGREHSEVYRSGGLSDRRGHGVYFSSIRGFKGLESPVVVLCELDALDETSRQQQLYVGLSRARNHCVVIAPG